MDELEKMKYDLENIVIDIYEPEHTRWNRKYSDRAEWFYICKIDKDTKLLTL